MSKELKKDWLPKQQARYGRRGREGKSRMLDELCEDYKYERKYAIKLLRGGLPAPTGRVHPGPERQYEVVEPIVRQIWLSAEQPCGKRLVPVLRQWLPYYEERYGELSARQRSLIRQVSPATLDRLLAPARAQHSGRGRSGTKPGSLLRSEIPIRTGSHWRKRYELPQTAYDRLCAPGMLRPKQRRQLRERYASLDPFDLKDQLEQKLKQILKLTRSGPASPQSRRDLRPQGARAKARSSPPCSF